MIVFDDELEVLDKILYGTLLSDCLIIGYDDFGSPAVYDFEQGETDIDGNIIPNSLSDAIPWICDAVDCRENLDNCHLTKEETKLFVDVCKKAGIIYNPENCKWDYMRDTDNRLQKG